MSDLYRILCGEFGRLIVYRLDHSITPHVHRMCQLLFRIGGEGATYGVKNREIEMGDDDVVLINAWEPHFYNHCAENGPITLFEIDLDALWLASLSKRFSLASHPRFFQVPRLAIGSEGRRKLDDLTQMISSCPAPRIEEVSALVADLVLEIASRLPEPDGLSSYDLVGGLRCDPRIRRVLSLTEESNIPALTVDHMVKTAGVSRPRFFQLFKQETQLTPHIFANMLRMENAIRLVSSKRPTVTDIALLLGFESPGNFTRFFRSHQGTTPVQYRRGVA